MPNFLQLKPEELSRSPFQMIGKEWMLITAGTPEKVNTMTASWGGLGVMWHKNVAFAVIRPQRYTKEFVEENESFSLSFFDEGFKKQLSYLGSVSGREEDKIAKAGLTTAFEDGVPYFEEAKTVLLCKKLFQQDYKPESFLDASLLERWYPERDLHTMYIAEVTKILSAQ